MMQLITKNYEGGATASTFSAAFAFKFSVVSGK